MNERQALREFGQTLFGMLYDAMGRPQRSVLLHCARSTLLADVVTMIVVADFMDDEAVSETIAKALNNARLLQRAFNNEGYIRPAQTTLTLQRLTALVNAIEMLRE